MLYKFLRAPETIVFIAGAPRTGTHMINAILCDSEDVQPLLTEASTFIKMIGKFRFAMHNNLKVHPNNYFSNKDEINQLSANILTGLTSHLRSKYKKPIVVLRGPMILKEQALLSDILPYCDTQCKLLISVRDPRDMLCSMKRWNENRIKRGIVPLAENLTDYLVDIVKASYEELNLNIDDKHFSVWKYEDIVSDTDSFITFLESWLRIRVKPMTQEAGWKNKIADLSKNNLSVSDAITPLYNKPVSSASVGRYKVELTEGEIMEIERRLSDFMKHYNYI